MQILINIPEVAYNHIKSLKYPTAFEKSIQKGVVLPKGHRIVDEYLVQEHLAKVPMEDRTFRKVVEILENFPTVIEADVNTMTVIISKCKGEGQGSCTRCEEKGFWNRYWMSMLYKVEGMEGCYCSKCLKEIIEEIIDGSNNN